MSKSNYERMKEAAKGPPKTVATPGRKTVDMRAEVKPLPPPKKDKKQKPPKPKNDAVGAMRLPRLPDGSAFEATWNEAKQEWTGLLMIPLGHGPANNARFDTGCKTFTQTSGAVRPLLFKLDSQYREWLKAQEPTTEEVK